MEQLNNYEITFILKSSLSEEAVESILADIRNLIKQEQAEMIRDEALGLREIAYPIKAEWLGLYYLMEFKAQPRVKDLFIDLLNKDDRVLRYMTLRLFIRDDDEVDQKRSDRKLKPKSGKKATT